MCKKCKHYRNSNKQMKSPKKNELIGDYCMKYKWNLAGMNKFPEGCL